MQFFFRNFGSKMLPAFAVDAADTSGAGDAFIGCFSNHYVKTHDVWESMRQASAFAALSVTKKGTQKSYSTPGEVEAFLQDC